MTLPPGAFIEDGVVVYNDQGYTIEEWERRQRHRERDRHRYHNDPERRAKVRAAAKTWNQAHPERFRELKREWYRRRYGSDPEFRERELAKRRTYEKGRRAARRVTVTVASLHEMRCMGPTQKTGCRCHKVTIYERVERVA